jgi:signal peptidase II
VSRFLRALALFVWVASLVGCDHVSKHLAQTKLADGTVYPLAGNLIDLRYAENRDIAFNLLRFVPESTRTSLIFVSGALSLLALGACLYVRRGARWPELLALSVLVAGALGNYIERALRGYVIDFLHVRYWPVFNVADIYITVGIFCLLLLSRARREAASPAPH